MHNLLTDAYWNIIIYQIHYNFWYHVIAKDSYFMLVYVK